MKQLPPNCQIVDENDLFYPDKLAVHDVGIDPNDDVVWTRSPSFGIDLQFFCTFLHRNCLLVYRNALTVNDLYASLLGGDWNFKCQLHQVDSRVRISRDLSNCRIDFNWCLG